MLYCEHFHAAYLSFKRRWNLVQTTGSLLVCALISNKSSAKNYSVFFQGKVHTLTTHTTILWPSWILYRTPQVSRHQKGKTNLDLLEQEIVSGSNISWAICISPPWPRQITTPASHHSDFTGRMPFLPPIQQCQSTEGYTCEVKNWTTFRWLIHFVIFVTKITGIGQLLLKLLLVVFQDSVFIQLMLQMAPGS